MFTSPFFARAPRRVGILILLLAFCLLPVSGGDRTDDILTSIQDRLEKEIRDNLSNEAHYDIEWRNGAMKKDRSALFVICAFRFQIDVDATSSSITTSGVSASSLQFDSYAGGFHANKYNYSAAVADISTVACRMKVSNPTVLMQFYVEIDKRGNATYKWIGDLDNDKSHLAYDASVIWSDYIKEEQSERDDFFAAIETKIGKAKSDMRSFIDELANATASASFDENGEPTVRFDVNGRDLLGEIRDCPGWVKGFILYGNPRKELHDRIFPDYDNQVQAYLNQVEEELGPLIKEGEEALRGLDAKRREALIQAAKDAMRSFAMQAENMKPDARYVGNDGRVRLPGYDKLVRQTKGLLAWMRESFAQEELSSFIQQGEEILAALEAKKRATIILGAEDKMRSCASRADNVTPDAKHIRLDRYGNRTAVLPGCEELISEIKGHLSWMRNSVVQEELTDFIQQGEEILVSLAAKKQAAIDAFNENEANVLNENELVRKREGLLVLLKAKYKANVQAMDSLRKLAAAGVFKSNASEAECKKLFDSNEEALEKFFSWGSALLQSDEMWEAKLDGEWFKKRLGNLQENMEFSPRCVFVPTDKPKDGLDLRSRAELETFAKAEALKRFPKTDEELKREDVAYVREHYPLYRQGQRVEITARVKGRICTYSGTLKKAGPGKVMIGSTLVTLTDLPEEIRISFQPEKHPAYVAKRLAECPVGFKYRQDRENAQRDIYYQTLLEQFRNNLPNGCIYADGQWVSPVALASNVLESFYIGSDFSEF